jgi:hypothetical protein
MSANLFFKHRKVRKQPTEGEKKKKEKKREKKKKS